jgi:hypothetical protein
MTPNDEILIVQESTAQYFCSEECIVEFFKPLSETYEAHEQSQRKELNLEEVEEGIHLLGSETNLQKLLAGPDDVYPYPLDQDGRMAYVHVLKIQDEYLGEMWLLAYCFYYNEAPSFIFHKTLTASEKLLTRLLPSAENEQTNEEQFELDLPEEANQQIEQLKSTELAKLMEHHTSEDIRIEEYFFYEDYLERTMEEPDEIFRYEFDDGTEGFCYIRTFRKDDKDFFYTALAIDISGFLSKDTDLKRRALLFPVFSFPSTDQNLYQSYNTGERVKGTLKN